ADLARNSFTHDAGWGGPPDPVRKPVGKSLTDLGGEPLPDGASQGFSLLGREICKPVRNPVCKPLAHLVSDPLPDDAADGCPLLWGKHGAAGPPSPPLPNPPRQPVGQSLSEPLAHLGGKPFPDGGPNGVSLLGREHGKLIRKPVWKPLAHLV